MGMIKHEDIIGYSFDDETICLKCIKKEEEDEANEDEIMTTDWAESAESRIFCDRCGKKVY